jgi:hypothetical protein
LRYAGVPVTVPPALLFFTAMTFSDHLKQMQDQILAQRGVLISYKRREIVIDDIPAVPTKTDFVNTKSGDYRTKYVEKEYIVEFELLKWEDKQIIPQSGDCIHEGETVYEVVPNEPKQCYRPVDSSEQYVRIFVQRIHPKK